MCLTMIWWMFQNYGNSRNSGRALAWSKLTIFVSQHFTEFQDLELGNESAEYVQSAHGFQSVPDVGNFGPLLQQLD